MATVEEDLIAAGAQVIWVLEETGGFDPGTAEACRSFVDSRGSDAGLCIGDDELMNTMLGGDVFDDSPFAMGRGFDLVVSRRDMVILDVTTHGTPAGNDNLTGPQLLDRVRGIIAGL